MQQTDRGGGATMWVYEGGLVVAIGCLSSSTNAAQMMCLYFGVGIRCYRQGHGSAYEIQRKIFHELRILGRNLSETAVWYDSWCGIILLTSLRPLCFCIYMQSDAFVCEFALFIASRRFTLTLWLAATACPAYGKAAAGHLVAGFGNLRSRFDQFYSAKHRFFARQIIGALNNCMCGKYCSSDFVIWKIENSKFCHMINSFYWFFFCELAIQQFF